jgi:hypothetical protein
VVIVAVAVAVAVFVVFVVFVVACAAARRAGLVVAARAEGAEAAVRDRAGGTDED